MKALLSNRVLEANQCDRLAQAGWSLTQYDAISIELGPVAFEPGARIAIFTSRHAVRACFSGPDLKEAAGIRALCVGEGTAALLRDRGIAVLEAAPNARVLADWIKSKYPDKYFVYYCGDQRLDIIPDTLNSLGMPWDEVVVYKTTLVKRAFDRSFDGILFFSPSGVEGYARSNAFGRAAAYCIGPTTAAAVRKHTERFKIADRPSVDAVIDLAIDNIPCINSQSYE